MMGKDGGGWAVPTALNGRSDMGTKTWGPRAVPQYLERGGSRVNGEWKGGGPTSGPTLITVGHKSDGKGSGLSPGKAAATARAHDPRGAVYGLRTDGSGPAAPYRGL